MSERSERLCDASGETIDETLENSHWCGPDLSWWEPKPEEPEESPTPPELPVLLRSTTPLWYVFPPKSTLKPLGE